MFRTFFNIQGLELIYTRRRRHTYGTLLHTYVLWGEIDNFFFVFVHEYVMIYELRIETEIPCIKAMTYVLRELSCLKK